MSDTSHLHATPPVEGDGISYSGILWFLVVLTATTLFCQALVWGMFELEQHRARANDAVRSPLAAPIASPDIVAGRIESGTLGPPPPVLVVNEPTVLSEFRASEEQTLTTYGWVDKTLGIARIPIDRAKELVVERGLPVRGAAPAAATAAPKAAAKAGAPAK